MKKLLRKCMKKHFFVAWVIFFLLVCCHAHGQDSVFLKASYAFKRIPDSTNPALSATDLFVLEVGSLATKFFSYNKIVSDSILSEQFNMQQNSNGLSVSLDMRGVQAGSSAIFFRSISSNVFSCSDELGMVRYKYIDTVGQLQWIIKQDTASYLGYKCIKAITRFRGRNYIAWFTQEIPVSAGPYKFCGLPGLIINIVDDKSNFEFTLTSLTFLTEKKALLLQEKKSILVTKKDFKRLVKLMISDMDAFAASQGFEFRTKSINGVENPPPPPKVPYNPIELE